MILSELGVIIAVALFILIEGIFSGAEIALLSADKIALKNNAKHSVSGAALALDLANHPERILSTTLFVTSICVIGTSTLMSLYLNERQVAHPEFFAILLTSPLVVLAGELFPKMLYRRYSTKLAPWVARPVASTYWLFYPVTRFLSAYTTHLSKLAGPIEELVTGKRHTTREDLESLLSYGKRETEIKTSAKRMIRRILDFKDSEAQHALIPLVRVDAIEETATIREALEKFERHRHSRMPVYSERIDRIVGVLENRDLFGAQDLESRIDGFVTQAHFVPEMQSLEDVLLEMRREDDELVVVVDEHGGAVGIITFEDIVEEIVGEINDEYDTEALPYKELSEKSWLIQAKMEIEQINEKLRLDIPQGAYETLSGFLLQQFGRIPTPRDELYFTTQAGPLRFTIRQANERHIESVLVDLLDE